VQAGRVWAARELVVLVVGSRPRAAVRLLSCRCGLGGAAPGDAKTGQARAEQAGDVARAALCRGQALAYTAATEDLAAVLAAVLAGNGT
jgi:hypothetical protein